jgi:DNA-binding GntR family transcriptional regulator
MTQAADRAYSALRGGILDGRYGSGARLGEIEVADELGLSRTPVREALRRLGSEGLVEVQPRRGARVRAWSTQDLEETYELRALLEGLAARRARRPRWPATGSWSMPATGPGPRA